MQINSRADTPDVNTGTRTQGTGCGGARRWLSWRRRPTRQQEWAVECLSTATAVDFGAPGPQRHGAPE